MRSTKPTNRLIPREEEEDVSTTCPALRVRIFPAGHLYHAPEIFLIEEEKKTRTLPTLENTLIIVDEIQRRGIFKIRQELERCTCLNDCGAFFRKILKVRVLGERKFDRAILSEKNQL